MRFGASDYKWVNALLMLRILRLVLHFLQTELSPLWGEGTEACNVSNVVITFTLSCSIIYGYIRH